MKVAALFTSNHNIFQHILGVFRTISEDGVGRTLLIINRKYHFISYHKMRVFIKLLNILAHPYDYMKRRRMAKVVAKKSLYKDRLPKKTSYCMLAPDEIQYANSVIENCRIFLDKKTSIFAQNKRTFMHLLIEDETENYDVSEKKKNIYNLQQIPGLTELALSTPLLETASSYLAEVPILASVNIYASLPNDTMEGSQLYHIDKGDFRQVKFIFAISDVTEDHGPFTFVPADKTVRVKEKLGEAFYGRVEDKTIYDLFGADISIKMLGPSGSLIIIDTGRCLHYGSRHIKKPRCVLEIQYMSRFSIAEPATQLAKLRIEKLQQLNALQKKALMGVNFTTEVRA